MSDTGPIRDPRTDEQLMVAFARGSSDAFHVLFLRYRQPLFGFFCRRLADRARAEELTQDAFIAVLRAQGRYEATALFRTYLYAVAFGILRADRRKAAFRGLFTGRADYEPSAPAGIEPGLALREAISKLDKIDREIVLLREFEELSYAEIAEVLHIPVNTVRSRLFRARAALRGLLTAPAPRANPITHVETSAEEHV